MDKTRKLMYMSLLVAMALMLHIIERNIPVPFVTPGAKLGLTNLVTLIALYTLPSQWDTLKIIVVRLLLSTIFGGSVSSLLYGGAGAMLSFLGMLFTKKVGKSAVSRIGVSAVGAVSHNIGQIIVASLIVQHLGVILYLPILSIAGITTGIFVGMSANYVIRHMTKINFFNKIS